jgi:hypothetical protein
LVSRAPFAEIAVWPKLRAVSPIEPRPRRTVIEAGRTGQDTRDELCELHEIAPVQRQVDDLGAVHHGSDCRVLGLKRGGAGHDLILSDLADLNADDARRLPDFQLAPRDLRAETWLLR